MANVAVLEPRDLQLPRASVIEVIVGPMFAGKTTELVRRLRRAAASKERVRLFKYARDTRYGSSSAEVKTHDEAEYPATPVSSVTEIREHLMDLRLDTLVAQLLPDVVGLDEAQFLSGNLVSLCEELAGLGVRVIVAALDNDYKRNKYPMTADLVALADTVTKLTAVCFGCQSQYGLFSHCTNAAGMDANGILIGGHDLYQALCRACYKQITAS